MVQTLTSTVSQLGVVFFVAIMAWLAIGRRRSGFLEWVGLKSAPTRSLAIGIAIGVVTAAFLLMVPGLLDMAGGERSVAGDMTRQLTGAALWLGLAVAAIFKTALSEELLFRGLIGKRLIGWLGFGPGNIIQAILFGLVHLLLLLIPTATTALVLFMVLLTGIGGWVSGWLNERMGDGSILPGWAAHASANLFAYGAITASVT